MVPTLVLVPWFLRVGGSRGCCAKGCAAVPGVQGPGILGSSRGFGGFVLRCAFRALCACCVFVSRSCPCPAFWPCCLLVCLASCVMSFATFVFDLLFRLLRSCGRALRAVICAICVLLVLCRGFLFAGCGASNPSCSSWCITVFKLGGFQFVKLSFGWPAE